jgi:hypothetical protein
MASCKLQPALFAMRSQRLSSTFSLDVCWLEMSGRGLWEVREAGLGTGRGYIFGGVVDVQILP